MLDQKKVEEFAHNVACGNLDCACPHGEKPWCPVCALGVKHGIEMADMLMAEAEKAGER